MKTFFILTYQFVTDTVVHLAFDRNLVEECGSFGDFFQHFLDQAYSLCFLFQVTGSLSWSIKP